MLRKPGALSLMIIGCIAAVSLQAGAEADQSELGKLIRARIEIGEMMMSYLKEQGTADKGQRPSAEDMQRMQADINARLTEVLKTHGLTIEEYRTRSKEVLSDDAAVARYLEQHPDLKKRYEALPSRGKPGGSGRY